MSATLTLKEVANIASSRNDGAVFRMCRAIVDTADILTLVGKEFNDR